MAAPANKILTLAGGPFLRPHEGSVVIQDGSSPTAEVEKKKKFFLKVIAELYLWLDNFSEDILLRNR